MKLFTWFIFRYANQCISAHLSQISMQKLILLRAEYSISPVSVYLNTAMKVGRLYHTVILSQGLSCTHPTPPIANQFPLSLWYMDLLHHCLWRSHFMPLLPLQWLRYNRFPTSRLSCIWTRHRSALLGWAVGDGVGYSQTTLMKTRIIGMLCLTGAAIGHNSCAVINNKYRTKSAFTVRVITGCTLIIKAQGSFIKRSFSIPPECPTLIKAGFVHFWVILTSWGVPKRLPNLKPPCILWNDLFAFFPLH